MGMFCLVAATSGMIMGKTSPPTPAPGGSTQMPRKRHRSLNVSVAVEPRGNNLYGKVSWNQIAPQNVKNRHDVLYNVDWASVSRNVDSTYPHCTIPNDHSATALDPTNEKVGTVSLKCAKVIITLRIKISSWIH